MQFINMWPKWLYSKILKIMSSQIFNMISRCTLHKNNIRPALTWFYLKVKLFRFPSVWYLIFITSKKVNRVALKVETYKFLFFLQSQFMKEWILQSIVFYYNLGSTTPDCYTKGQLISKCPFGVFVWTKKPTIF